MLSDLEAATIGEILKHQPCTAHFVRMCFRDSPTKHFSDSAGSVYPMMKRLQKTGQLESFQKKDANRMVRYYRCTAAGKSALRKWLGEPLAEAAALTADPLRTRILYLHRLPKSQRAKWLQTVETTLSKKLSSVQDLLLGMGELSGDDAFYLQLAHENAVMELKSRLKWVSKAKQKMVENRQL